MSGTSCVYIVPCDARGNRGIVRDFLREVRCDDTRKRSAILVHLCRSLKAKFPKMNSPMGQVTRGTCAKRRELDKGVVYEHEKDFGSGDYGPGDFLRCGRTAAAVCAGAARESVYLQCDGGGENRYGGELSASQRFDDDWISGDAAAAAGKG